jgi:hypothetical protein
MAFSGLVRFDRPVAAGMAAQRGFFDTDERLHWLSTAGDAAVLQLARVRSHSLNGRSG